MRRAAPVEGLTSAFPERYGGAMKKKMLGKSGIEASVVGLGTWAIGGWMWGGTDDKAAVKAIHTGIDAGINLLDTAPVYGFGRSEEVVGKAIADRRDGVVLATKCGLVWHKEAGELHFKTDRQHITADGSIAVYKYLHPESVKWEVEQSLKRLGTDRIDLLQTHWQESTTPVCDTMAALMELKAEGKIRAIGCSNATLAQMDEYRAAGQLDVDQECYSMLDRKREDSNLPYCAGHDMAFLAYSPLALGLLTGKVTPDRTFGEGDMRRVNPRFSVENRSRVLAMLAEFQPIADAHGLSLSQLAIAWTIAQPGCTHALVGARTEAQARENARAGEVTLSREECATMTAIVERFAI